MLLSPKKTKFRKIFKPRASNRLATRGTELAFGEYGLKAIQEGRLTAQQIESARRAMSRVLKKQGRIIRKVFPDKIITKKPAETRMGGGKGGPETWCALIRPGKIIFEVLDANKSSCKKAFDLAKSKLPMKAVMVSNEAKGVL